MTVREQLAGVGMWAGAELTMDESVTMASPSWWGADSARYSVRATERDPVAGAAAFVKVMAPHARAYVDLDAAFGAARAAGEAGIGPTVHAADVKRGVLVMADLTGEFGTATVGEFDEASAVARLVTLRRAVHRLPALTRIATVFEDIRAAHRLVTDAGGRLPADLGWMLRRLEPAERRITSAGYDLAACHGDGNGPTCCCGPPTARCCWSTGTARQ
jgi:hypothetical protein